MNSEGSLPRRSDEGLEVLTLLQTEKRTILPVDFAAKGEWTGTLETGAIEVPLFEEAK